MKFRVPAVRLPGVFVLLMALTACHSPAQNARIETSQVQASQVQSSRAQSTRQSTQAQASAVRQDATDPVSGLNWTTVSTLPKQGQQTYRLILKGGPFPYAKDGVVFQNREAVLPRRSRGSYHEYTVKTPGSSDRGARRIVCAALPECYYTGDHYASFQRIRP
jgi:ribonuclease T1